MWPCGGEEEVWVLGVGCWVLGVVGWVWVENIGVEECWPDDFWRRVVHIGWRTRRAGKGNGMTIGFVS